MDIARLPFDLILIAGAIWLVVTGIKALESGVISVRSYNPETTREWFFGRPCLRDREPFYYWTTTLSHFLGSAFCIAILLDLIPKG